ncbi:ABC transporter substrate-binding protein [Flavobacterium sp. GT3R68]|uniref:ABC transporter substrate-binding protein n=1 Tax=Flavobacterium sp. GT3R68 TaxID=2594437 RepID=UPI000F897C32|nr:helical backbone metal receptor [Flavobacterium sp. GT3R68]RTY95365.1 cobalamin-binding protein [Flavobacterium sp. GSN2]TRW90895.1 ABC transporter substrate-binding protein [Flavobacterium sp. GT3R68]
MKTLIDQLGTSHSFASAPKRIVSLVPSQTELLYDLGQEVKIVGLTKFCVHPVHLKSIKKIIGGTKKVHIDRIRELNPDLIIANKEENTLDMVMELRQICPVWVTNILTYEDNLQMISDFGQLLNCETEAQIWIDKIDFAYRNFQNFIQEIPVKKAAYFIWANPYMVAGSDNFINEMLQLNHFQNIYESKSRYPEIELEKIGLEGNSDLILLSSEPFPFKEEHALEIGRYTHAKTVFVDGEMFSWYGSRILKAFEYFKLLH